MAEGFERRRGCRLRGRRGRRRRSRRGSRLDVGNHGGQPSTCQPCHSPSRHHCGLRRRGRGWGQCCSLLRRPPRADSRSACCHSTVAQRTMPALQPAEKMCHSARRRLRLALACCPHHLPGGSDCSTWGPTAVWAGFMRHGLAKPHQSASGPEISLPSINTLADGGPATVNRNSLAHVGED